MDEPVVGEGFRGAVTRRQALRAGAFVGTALWVTPVVQAVSVARASADQPSGGKPTAREKARYQPKDMPKGE